MNIWTPHIETTKLSFWFVYFFTTMKLKYESSLIYIFMFTQWSVCFVRSTSTSSHRHSRVYFSLLHFNHPLTCLRTHDLSYVSFRTPLSSSNPHLWSRAIICVAVGLLCEQTSSISLKPLDGNAPTDLADIELFVKEKTVQLINQIKSPF